MRRRTVRVGVASTVDAASGYCRKFGRGRQSVVRESERRAEESGSKRMSLVSRTEISPSRAGHFDAFDLTELLLLLVHPAADGRADGGSAAAPMTAPVRLLPRLVADDAARRHAAATAPMRRAAFGLPVRIVRRGRAGKGERGER